MCKKDIEIVMNSKLHDEARVVSAQFGIQLVEVCDMRKLLDTLTGGMESINAWAYENDIIIGHVKAFATCDGESVMVSTTGDDVQTKGSQNMPTPPCDVNVGLAAIVFGAELREVEKQLEGLISKLLDGFDIEYLVIHEGAHVHDDSCGCGDQHHHHSYAHDHLHNHDHQDDHGHSYDNEHHGCEHDHHHKHNHDHCRQG
jgi:hypothetical protein